jgi:Ca2+-binding RTX toxin-like protein
MLRLESRKGGRSSRKHGLVVALVAGWLAAAAASAGTIGIRGNTLVIGAEASDGGVVLLGSMSATDFMLDVGGAVFDIVTPGCSGGPAAFSGPLAGFTLLEVIGGTGDDILDFSSLTIGATLVGGNGDDIMFGGLGVDTMYGGPGDDVLLALGNVSGSDLLFGGPGDDIAVGESDQGDANPVFEPLPRQPISVPAPGSLLLLLAGFGAVAMSRHHWMSRIAEHRPRQRSST